MRKALFYMFLTHQSALFYMFRGIQNALFYKFQYLSVSSTLKYYGIECIEGRITHDSKFHLPKSPIVVQKVPKKATFGTTIGTFFRIFVFSS